MGEYRKVKPVAESERPSEFTEECATRTEYLFRHFYAVILQWLTPPPPDDLYGNISPNVEPEGNIGSNRPTDRLAFLPRLSLTWCYVQCPLRPSGCVFCGDIFFYFGLRRAGSKDGETGLNVEPAKARETESFLHEVCTWYSTI